MKLQPLSPYFGARVTELTAEDFADSENASRMRSALHRFGVLQLPALHLAPRAQVQLAAIFGQALVDSHPKFGALDDAPEVSIVINDADNPPDINVWHTDATYFSVPAGTCVLQAIEVPPVGGDTLFLSMTAAYDALSDPIKKLLFGLEIEHRLSLDSVPPERAKLALNMEIAAVHPLVRRIPETGLFSLYVNRHYAKRVLGLNRHESDGLLNLLCNHAESPDFQLRLSWESGDVVIWDNRSTQHFAAADYYPARRVMHRVALLGERPIAAEAAPT